jgi:hypothetical protein
MMWTERQGYVPFVWEKEVKPKKIIPPQGGSGTAPAKLKPLQLMTFERRLKLNDKLLYSQRVELEELFFMWKSKLATRIDSEVSNDPVNVIAFLETYEFLDISAIKNFLQSREKGL